GGKPVVYAGARGACSFGSIPAYGAFYTPQNWCMCCPPQISGFLCFGPVRSVPTEQEMTALVEPIRGPAFGESVAVAAVGGTAWPMARCDAARSAGTSAVAPAKLESIWQRRIPLPDLSTPLARNWREYLNPPLTGPTVAGAVVAAAVMDANQVVGLELATGKLLWRVTAGARIDSPPTLYRGVCLFGAHDGLVYAVSARDGRLRWKLRIAPRAQRMVSYGKVESPWPAVGSVLVADGVAYASAGRTQGSDGGIVVRAFDPLAGRLIWSAALPASGNPRSLRRNDLLVKTDDTLQLMTTRLDPKTGQIVPNTMLQALAKRTSLARQLQTEQRRLKTAQPEQKPQIEKRVAELKRQIQQAERQSGEIALWLGAGGRSCEGLLHWNWPRLGDRKYVRMNYGNVGGKLVSWDRTAVVRMVRDRQIALRAMGQVGPAGQPPRGPDLWSRSLPTDHQVTSLALAANAVICAGGVYAEDGEASGFVCLLARKDGKTLVARRLPAPVAYNGLAVVDHAICVSLVNGTVWLLGDRVSARPPSE
ncbi:MAG: PQQ-binding-like beta-propeller repeat protein, partial [Planctomycetes bacterium]|nr:PQQ-binding-like beta-propeller repeat protein [Planctomycetota bacterium]